MKLDGMGGWVGIVALAFILYMAYQWGRNAK